MTNLVDFDIVNSTTKYHDFALVVKVGDGIVYAVGLQGIEAGALVEVDSFLAGQSFQGMVLNLETHQIAIDFVD